MNKLDDNLGSAIKYMSEFIEKWLEKAKKELKISDIKSIDYQANGVRYNTFAHQKVDNSQNFVPPKEDNNWSIGLKIYNPTENLVPYLFDGAESVTIEVDDTYDLLLLSSVFDKVDLQFVRVELNVDPRLSMDVINSILDTHRHLSVFLTTSSAALNRDQSVLKIRMNQSDSYGKSLFIIAEQIDGNPDIREIRANLTVDKNILFNIAKIRSARILIFNLLNALGRDDICTKISCDINQAELEDDHFEQNLIIMSSAGLSAVIGGIDTLYLSPKYSAKKSLKELYRLSFNIQHILKHESRLDEVVDPTKGSFFIEDLTAKITSREWESFKNMLR